MPHWLDLVFVGLLVWIVLSTLVALFFAAVAGMTVYRERQRGGELDFTHLSKGDDTWHP